MLSFIIIYAALFTVQRAVSRIFPDYPNTSILLQQIFGVFLPVFIYFIIHNKKYISKRDLKANGTVMLFSLAAGFCQQLISTLINYPAVILLSRFGIKPPNMPETPEGIQLLAYIFLICCLPAVTEEVLFRKYTFSVFEKTGRKTAAVITAIIFGTVHCNLFSIVPLTVTGLILSYIIYKGFPLICTILFHFSFNMAGTILEILTKYENINTALNNYFWHINFIAATAVILFLIYIRMEGNKNG